METEFHELSSGNNGDGALLSSHSDASPHTYKGLHDALFHQDNSSQDSMTTQQCNGSISFS